MNRFGEQLNEILTHTYRAVGELESAMLRDALGGRLSIGEMHMLECVGRAGEKGLSVTEAAREMEITPSSATVSLKKLEKKGYVSKRRAPEDGRRVVIRLTEKGRRTDIGHRYFHRQMAHEAEKIIPEADRAILLDGLRSIDAFLTRKAGETNRTSEQRGNGRE